MNGFMLFSIEVIKTHNKIDYQLDLFTVIQNDPATLLKCLTISAEMMDCSKVDSMIPSLLTLKDVLVCIDEVCECFK